MKIIYTSENTFVLRILRSEEVVEKILGFCAENNIIAAWVQGLGAVDQATISYYDLTKREYVSKTFDEEMELISMIGNIATIDYKQVLHAHISLARKDYSVIGGHLNSIRISGTGEIYITKIDTTFEREFDEETGLKLLKD